MASRLSDIQPGEVSLVRRGANRRRFLLAKSDGEIDSDLAEVLAAPSAHESVLLDAVRKAGGDESVEKAAAGFARLGAALTDAFGKDGVPADVLKAMQAQMDDDDGPAGDGGNDDDDDPDTLSKADADREHTVYKRDFSPDDRKALAAKGQALKDGSYPIAAKADLGPALTLAQSGHGDTDAAKALIKRRAVELGATDQLPDDWKVNKEDRMSETAQAVPVKKEDGTWDLSAVPEDQRPALELVLKAHDDEVAELRKQAETETTKADEAIKIAKAEQEKRETREFIAKSAELDQLVKDDDEFGPVLREIAKAEEAGHLSEGTVKKLDTVLKAANETIASGSVFNEFGRAGHGSGGDAETKVENIAKALREADPTLTKEQAFSKALEQNPALYDEIRKEQ